MIQCYKYTKEGRCSNCGNCCTELIPITNNELKLIKAYVKEKHIEPFSDVLFDLDGKFSINLLCPFRDMENKKCMIYEVRPKICRLFKCDQSLDVIEKHKNNAHLKAHYNKLERLPKSPNDRLPLTKTTSLRESVYGDKMDTALIIAGNVMQKNIYLKIYKECSAYIDITEEVYKKLCVKQTQSTFNDLGRPDLANEGYAEKVVDRYFKYLWDGVQEYKKATEEVK